MAESKLSITSMDFAVKIYTMKNKLNKILESEILLFFSSKIVLALGCLWYLLETLFNGLGFSLMFLVFVYPPISLLTNSASIYIQIKHLVKEKNKRFIPYLIISIISLLVVFIFGYGFILAAEGV